MKQVERKGKGILRFIITLAFVVGIFTGIVPETSMIAKAVSGTGTENDPYVVTTWTELSDKMSEGGCIQLGNDIPIYTVTYNGNDNTSGNVPTDTSSPYITGSTVTVLDNTGNLVKNGYVFTGWNTATNGDNPVTTNYTTISDAISAWNIAGDNTHS